MATPFLSPLLRHGPELASLLRKATESSSLSSGGDHDEGLHQEVGVVIDELLNELNVPEGQFIEESMAKVTRKLGVILSEFAKADPNHASSYDELLAERVRAAFASDPPVPPQTRTRIDSRLHQDVEEPCEARIESLVNRDRELLSCFCLFPSGVQVTTRELFNLLYGIKSGVFPKKESDLGKCLTQLQDEGLVESLMKTTTDLGNPKSFRMRAGVHSRLMNSTTTRGFTWKAVAVLAEAEAEVEGEGGMCLPTHPDGTTKLPPLHQILMLVNGDKRTLETKRLDWLPKMESLKVLHLGCFHHHGWNRRVLLQDEGLLASLGHLKQLVVLSLKGVSGITRLPESICDGLPRLEVLDLKACHDLECLPAGIGRLTWLIYLDVSRCFYLGHIPKGVARLRYLQVLKGFIIRTDPEAGDDVAEQASSSCQFSDLKSMGTLVKLSVRSRRMDFPTTQDLKTLSCLSWLRKLRVTWVGDAAGHIDREGDATTKGWIFGRHLEKLELEGAPSETTAASLCRHPSKLYIKGGPLRYFSRHEYLVYGAEVVRLRYLSQLQMGWGEFKSLFPGLRVLEVFQCPKLTGFPCDQNGLWTRPHLQHSFSSSSIWDSDEEIA